VVVVMVLLVVVRAAGDLATGGFSGQQARAGSGQSDWRIGD
jgi:hypothetical protein